MNALAPRSKCFLAIVAFAALGLTGCDNAQMSETLAQIKAIKVDDGSIPNKPRLGKEDAQLVMATAQTAAHELSKDKNGKSHVTFAVLDPLQMPNHSYGEPVDTGLAPATETGSFGPRPTPEQTARLLSQAAHDLPDVPVVREASHPPLTAVAASEMPSAGRLVQVGSFGTIDAAKKAWNGLQARYPGVGRYSPTFQPVTTADGRPMVRLKLGPVTSSGQAQELCRQIDVTDSWCAKAG